MNEVSHETVPKEAQFGVSDARRELLNGLIAKTRGGRITWDRTSWNEGNTLSSVFQVGPKRGFAVEIVSGRDEVRHFTLFEGRYDKIPWEETLQERRALMITDSVETPEVNELAAIVTHRVDSEKAASLRDAAELIEGL